MKPRAMACVAAALSLTTVSLSADPTEEQRVRAMRNFGGREYNQPSFPERETFPTSGFTFCRIHYTSYGEDPDTNTLHGRWLIDYPDSDQNFSARLTEMTTLRIDKAPSGEFKTAIARLTDPELQNYPFIYIVEPGELNFSDEEVEALRSYLLRGGFLMVDDFWGTMEGENWDQQFARVAQPAGITVKELGLDHPIFHQVFELKEKPQVPNPWHWMNTGGGTSERYQDSAVVHYKAAYAPDGRMVGIFCHNTDTGDGWERETISEEYFREMSVKKAFPLGVNIVVYALTH